ncbi:arginyl-tRNA synthetase [Entomoplasma ellychniae]|uniref:Arginine--tRNA ligase n=1 Tax=Entomoplasma ellychniae TaxID=2114 RepID=A0A8E2QVW7_9MOLU|nr:arginine--tRNA ligase [Entomoplasma ellychniae]PPE04657.1 arginyl-tRNA synthetase [Entomoplasma ellychniae]
MNNIFDIIKTDLNEISKQLHLKKEPLLELNKNNINTHFSTSIALINAKDKKMNPMELAESIKVILLAKSYYSEVEVAKPGFINIKLKCEFISTILKNINTLKKMYGFNNKKNKLINLEFVSANPTGFLHVGHARNAVVGSALEKILIADGYDTQTEYYINDAGNQINILAVTVFVHYLWSFGIEAVKPENSYGGTFYDDLAQIIKDKYGDKFVKIKYDETQILDEKTQDVFKNESVNYFLEEIKLQLKAFGVTFNYFSSEKEMYVTKDIDKLFKELEKNNATYKSEGALWLKSSKYGDDKDRVLIKTDGSLTYMVPDLAMHNSRLKRSKADLLINVFGGDHHGYIARMRAGLELLGYNPNILEIEIVQMVRVVKDGQEYKMSKRKGTAVWLVDIMEMVGKDALRYMLASKSSSSHMDLDLDLVQQKNATNPVYYAQYATARCNSVLKQAKEKKVNPNYNETSLLTNDKELQLLLLLDSFNQVIAISAKNRAPQIICEYIQNISRQFHSYYSDNKIIDESNIKLSESRVGLVSVILQTLQNSFDLIGIQALEKM